MTAIVCTNVNGAGVVDAVRDLRVTTTDVVLSSSYPTGGEPVTAADLGLARVVAATANVVTTSTHGPGNAAALVQGGSSVKIKCQDTAETAEVTSATDLSAATVRVVAIGV